MIQNGFLVFVILTFLFSGCQKNLTEYSDIRIFMGTTVIIKVYSKDNNTAGKSVASAFDEIKRIEDIFSIYRNNSEISILNKKGSAEVSDEVRELIGRSKYFSEISEGAFDITVLPVIELWRNAKKKEKMPTQAEIENANKFTDYRNIIINEGKVSFLKKGMKADFGGIAKGYAVDRAVNILKKSGIKIGMVNAGGNIRCFGGKIWFIALQNPREKKDFVTILKLKNKSVATSGDYERFFSLDKKKISHIINPITGFSAEDSISSTIVTDTATDADALSTASFGLFAEKGIKLIEKYKNAECLIIDKERKIYKSPRFSEYE